MKQKKPYLRNESTIDSKEESLDFVNKHGFVTLFPVRGKRFPNLYQATKGDREEKFNKAWGWADELSVKQRQIYYGKLIYGQVTLISMEMLPYFYKLCRKDKFTGTPEKILDFIKQNGATSTTDLRKSLGLTGKNKKNEFVKALNILQMAFAITVANKGKPPRYTHTWDLTENWVSEGLIRRAESIKEEVAKTEIVAKLLENHVISEPEDAYQLLRLKL